MISPPLPLHLPFSQVSADRLGEVTLRFGWWFGGRATQKARKCDADTNLDQWMQTTANSTKGSTVYTVAACGKRFLPPPPPPPTHTHPARCRTTSAFFGKEQQPTKYCELTTDRGRAGKRAMVWDGGGGMRTDAAAAHPTAAPNARTRTSWMGQLYFSLLEILSETRHRAFTNHAVVSNN